MKWKSSLPKLPLLLYYLAKLIGLAPFIVKNNTFHPPTLLAKIYPVFVAASYFLFASMAFVPGMEEFYKQKYSLFLRIWGALQYFLSIPSILGTLITFLLMREKIVCLMKELCTIDNVLKSLGVAEMDHGKVFENIFLTTVTANAFVVATLIVLISIEPNWNNIIRIKFSIDSWFAFNTILIFAQILIFIRRRFTLVNEKLYELATPAGLIGFPHHTQIFVTSRNNNRGRNQPGSERVCSNLQRIRIIGNLHTELSDLLHRTTRVFATPILLISLRFFVDLVLYFYWIYSASVKSSHYKIRYISCSLLKMSFLTMQLFIMTHASETICKQGNATKAVLFRVWNQVKPEKLTDDGVHRLEDSPQSWWREVALAISRIIMFHAIEFLKFSCQLLHTKLAVSALGFMDLGYSFIFKIFGTVITYLIIVIQFDISRRSTRVQFENTSTNGSYLERASPHFERNESTDFEHLP